MAATAGRRDIVPVHARQRIGMRQDVVGHVATGAHRGHRKAALHQSFAVNAFRVTLDDFMLTAHVAHCGLLSLAMAACTEDWNVRWERGRLRIQFAEHAVRPVALLTRRRVQVILDHELAVHASLVLLANLRMASRAVRLPRDRFTGPNAGCVDLRVTLTARDFHMTGICQIIRPHEERAPVLGRFQLTPLVTPQTILVSHPLSVEDLPHFMRLVTVNARRKNVCLPLPQLPFNHLPVDCLNLRVASCAG